MGEDATVSQIAEMLGKTKNNINQIIYKLYKRGELVRYKPGRYAPASLVNGAGDKI